MKGYYVGLMILIAVIIIGCIALLLYFSIKRKKDDNKFLFQDQMDESNAQEIDDGPRLFDRMSFVPTFFGS